MNKRDGKSPKLRDFICVICSKPFQNYLSPSDIASGRGKVCSKDCKGKLNSINKTKGQYIKCLECGKDVWSRPTRPRKYCGECWDARTGKSVSTDGYLVFSRVKIHRTMYEKHYNIKLRPMDIIHHINGDKLDNRIENLRLVSRSEHNKIHFSIDDGLTNTQRFNLRHKRGIII